MTHWCRRYPAFFDLTFIRSDSTSPTPSLYLQIVADVDLAFRALLERCDPLLMIHGELLVLPLPSVHQLVR